MNIETRAIHAGRGTDPASAAVSPPLHLSTTFERAPDGSYPHGWSYTTFGNPARDGLEAAFADLEGGAGAVATASGMAAIAAVLSILSPGERVLASVDLFQGTARYLRDELERYGIHADFVDICNPDAAAAALRPQTRMIWLDTPSNPLLRVADIAALAEIAHRHGAWLAVDNTFATFALQRPLMLAADVSIYSTTKYIGGHADVVGGVAVFREAGPLLERARKWQINAGAVPSPFDCWLVHRGLRTLPWRMKAHSANALSVARALARHPWVSEVFYPGLEDAPGHAVAKRQMSAFGGVVSIAVRGGRQAALATAARVRLFTRAASLGGLESLIEHRASSPIQTTGRGTGLALRDDLLRLSVGLEHAEDLIADLDQALSGNSGPG